MQESLANAFCGRMVQGCLNAPAQSTHTAPDQQQCSASASASVVVWYQTLKLTCLTFCIPAVCQQDGSSASHEDPAFESSWQAHQSDAASLGIALGALQPSNRPIHHRVVSAEGGHVAVAQAVVGISFNQGQVQSVLPLVEADQQLVPPPYVMRIVQRPRARSARTPLTKFKVLTVTAGTFMDETIADSSATGSAMSASGEARTSSISVEDTNQSQKGVH